jgi:hypothetical protein
MSFGIYALLQAPAAQPEAVFSREAAVPRPAPGARPPVMPVLPEGRRAGRRAGQEGLLGRKVIRPLKHFCPEEIHPKCG